MTARRSEPEKYLINTKARSEPTPVSTMICSGGMLIFAISFSHLNLCHQPLPRSIESVPSSIFSVIWAVGLRLESRDRRR